LLRRVTRKQVERQAEEMLEGKIFERLV